MGSVSLRCSLGVEPSALSVIHAEKCGVAVTVLMYLAGFKHGRTAFSVICGWVFSDDCLV
jgi:hypothetical protein